jgi:hypothetical protein
VGEGVGLLFADSLGEDMTGLESVDGEGLGDGFALLV